MGTEVAEGGTQCHHDDQRNDSDDKRTGKRREGQQQGAEAKARGQFEGDALVSSELRGLDTMEGKLTEYS